MSEHEKFLERWSRRKREAIDEAALSKPKEADAKKELEPTPTAVSAEAEKPFDLESLPSLESITGDTDIRGFLQEGVPADLKHEALRRAWSADPGIRDFVELVENGWDFNDPNAVVGFGPIEPEEVARLMAQFVLTSPDEKKVVQASETPADQHDLQAEKTSGPVAPAPSVSSAPTAAGETDVHVASQDQTDEPGQIASDDPTS